MLPPKKSRAAATPKPIKAGDTPNDPDRTMRIRNVKNMKVPTRKILLFLISSAGLVGSLFIVTFILLSSLLYRLLMYRISTTSVTMVIGPMLIMKSENEMPYVSDMIMFGGSPMAVAVPAIFATMISVITRGFGSNPISSPSSMVTTAIKRTTATLSRKAERAAVIMMNA